MSDELDTKLRELGRGVQQSVESLPEDLVRTRRNAAVAASLVARKESSQRGRLNVGSLIERFLESLRPRSLAPYAGACLVLLAIAFGTQSQRHSSSVLPSSSLQESDLVVEQEDEEMLTEDDFAEDYSEFAEELESDLAELGDEEIETMSGEALGFGEEDFEQEEETSSEYGTESI